jgi:hypothetical protein
MSLSVEVQILVCMLGLWVLVNGSLCRSDEHCCSNSFERSNENLGILLLPR